MKSILSALILISLTLSSCDRAMTIDGKSEETFKKSLEDMKASLPTEERESFDRAVMATALEGANLLEAAMDAEGMKRRMRDRLNGKTAADIIARAEDIQDQQVDTEIEELERRAKLAEEATDGLKAFKINRSRFRFQDSGFISKPIIEISVTNNTGSAISRAYFRGILATPGRSIPWVDDEFNYEIRGGLEPGESATWNLAPNMFGDWGQAPKDREDMVFSAIVTRVDGADGQPLLDARFSEDDRKRLDYLRSTKK